ncbi:hypothetical protein HDU96_008840 [Phlyctochytrium bullatum]|nr:hypothetical protein HDU96_008840 [Phlyctochytrium bullatum]
MSAESTPVNEGMENDPSAQAGLDQPGAPAQAMDVPQAVSGSAGSKGNHGNAVIGMLPALAPETTWLTETKIAAEASTTATPTSAGMIDVKYTNSQVFTSSSSEKSTYEASSSESLLLADARETGVLPTSSPPVTDSGEVLRNKVPSVTSMEGAKTAVTMVLLETQADSSLSASNAIPDRSSMPNEVVTFSVQDGPNPTTAVVITDGGHVSAEWSLQTELDVIAGPFKSMSSDAEHGLNDYSTFSDLRKSVTVRPSSFNIAQEVAKTTDLLASEEFSQGDTSTTTSAEKATVTKPPLSIIWEMSTTAITAYRDLPSISSDTMYRNAGSVTSIEPTSTADNIDTRSSVTSSGIPIMEGQRVTEAYAGMTRTFPLSESSSPTKAPSSTQSIRGFVAATARTEFLGDGDVSMAETTDSVSRMRADSAIVTSIPEYERASTPTEWPSSLNDWHAEPRPTMVIAGDLPTVEPIVAITNGWDELKPTPTPSNVALGVAQVDSEGIVSGIHATSPTEEDLNIENFSHSDVGSYADPVHGQPPVATIFATAPDSAFIAAHSLETISDPWIPAQKTPDPAIFEALGPTETVSEEDWMILSSEDPDRRSTGDYRETKAILTFEVTPTVAGLRASAEAVVEAAEALFVSETSTRTAAETPSSIGPTEGFGETVLRTEFDDGGEVLTAETTDSISHTEEMEESTRPMAEVLSYLPELGYGSTLSALAYSVDERHFGPTPTAAINVTEEVRYSLEGISAGVSDGDAMPWLLTTSTTDESEVATNIAMPSGRTSTNYVDGVYFSAEPIAAEAYGWVDGQPTSALDDFETAGAEVEFLTESDGHNVELASYSDDGSHVETLREDPVASIFTEVLSTSTLDRPSSTHSSITSPPRIIPTMSAAPSLAGSRVGSRTTFAFSAAGELEWGVWDEDDDGTSRGSVSAGFGSTPTLTTGVDFGTETARKIEVSTTAIPEQKSAVMSTSRMRTYDLSAVSDNENFVNFGEDSASIATGGATSIVNFGKDSASIATEGAASMVSDVTASAVHDSADDIESDSSWNGREIGLEERTRAEEIAIRTEDASDPPPLTWWMSAVLGEFASGATTWELDEQQPTRTTSPPAMVTETEPAPATAPSATAIGLSVAGGLVAIGGAAAVAVLYKTGAIGTTALMKVVPVTEGMIMSGGAGGGANPLMEVAEGVHSNPLYQPGSDGAYEGMWRGFGDGVV